MAIVIYTYSNPYKINKEPYWAMIKNAFHLCVSQTMVNGLCDQYKEFYKGKLTTISRFINHLYKDWESDVTVISQRAAIDNVIESLSFSEALGIDIDCEDIVTSLKRNRSYVVQSIRIMFELGMQPNNIKEELLTYEQKCIVEIFKELIRTDNKLFKLKKDFKNEDIDKAISETVDDSLQNDEHRDDIANIKNDVIVVHGIHQFSPIMLRTIEILGQYKNVVILFNYQPDYKNVYQTWLDVYSWFESKINISTHNYHDSSQENEGGIIADNMAAMIAGSTAAIDFSKKTSVTVFDNQTEFAGYIAKKFEEAEKLRAKEGNIHPALYYMDEQIYAANSGVNEVLKIYFPEQFGERDFLDYPIGHFFISVTNMWDPESQAMSIRDISDIYECLSCGIIAESKPGTLISTLDKCRLYVSNEDTIKGIIKRLKRLKRRLSESDDIEEQKELSRLEYYNIEEEAIDELIEGLNELNSIAEQFFKDFNDQRNDFKKFYQKIYEVLVSKVLEVQDIDDEFRDIVERVLTRLKDVKEVEASASFDCLRETMQLYLQQTPKEGKGANWIVRNFEQIDGDVLRKNRKDNQKTYHFACLSDTDMSITHKDEFPWPLDIEFFEVAQAPVDWKYQVFVTSRMEYKNFRRYALVYGLAFSKCNIKLSYIKNEKDGESELYYLLRILNADVIPYEPEPADNRKKKSDYIEFGENQLRKFSQQDLMKYRLCNYRFLMESIVDKSSVYKDEFLIRQYLAVVLEHRARKHFSGKKYIRGMVYSYISEQMDDLIVDFPFVNQSERIDVINMSLDYVEKSAVKSSSFVPLKDSEYEYMKTREEFLSVPIGKKASEKENEIFKPSTQAEIENTLNETTLKEVKYFKLFNGVCEKCASKDICLEIFRTKRK